MVNDSSYAFVLMPNYADVDVDLYNSLVSLSLSLAGSQFLFKGCR